MLDIALYELMGRAEEKVLADKSRLSVDKRHRVLQLIAKAEGTTGLIVSASRPKATCQSLV
jgi:hypothetical protein